jgi:hypothetical protein
MKPVRDPFFFSRGTFKDMFGKAVNQTQFRKNSNE